MSNLGTATIEVTKGAYWQQVDQRTVTFFNTDYSLEGMELYPPRFRRRKIELNLDGTADITIDKDQTA